MRFWIWLIARLAVAILLVGWVFSALFLPDSGKKEFQRSRDALKKVDTFHYSMTADSPTQHTEVQADLVCSEDSFHRKTHVERTGAGDPLIVDIETLRTGGNEYRLMSNGLWRRDFSGLEPAETTCKRIAQNQRAWIVPDINNFIEHGIIEKGDKKTIAGKRCREWKVADLSAEGRMLGRQATHVTLCLDLDDHLPREMYIAESHSHFAYDFDNPIHIEVPEPLEPEPSHNNYQPPPNPGLTLADPDEN